MAELFLMTFQTISDIIDTEETLYYKKQVAFATEKRWTMDIASVAMAMNHASSLSKVGTAMLNKTMESNEALGQGLINMIDSAAMERSVNPHIGSNFDMIV